MLRALTGATKEEMRRISKIENRSARDSRAHASPQCACKDTSTTGIGKLDFSYYQGSTAKDHTLTKEGDVRIKLMAEHICPPDVLIGRAFRQTGLGRPAECIRQEQLRVVKRFLKTTQKPIAAIAREAGFISITHFANFVKRSTGMTARELRRVGKF